LIQDTPAELPLLMLRYKDDAAKMLLGYADTKIPHTYTRLMPPLRLMLLPR